MGEQAGNRESPTHTEPEYRTTAKVRRKNLWCRSRLSSLGHVSVAPLLPHTKDLTTYFTRLSSKPLPLQESKTPQQRRKKEKNLARPPRDTSRVSYSSVAEMGGELGPETAIGFSAMFLIFLPSFSSYVFQVLDKMMYKYYKLGTVVFCFRSRVLISSLFSVLN